MLTPEIVQQALNSTKDGEFIHTIETATSFNKSFVAATDGIAFLSGMADSGMAGSLASAFLGYYIAQIEAKQPKVVQSEGWQSDGQIASGRVEKEASNG